MFYGEEPGLRARGPFFIMWGGIQKVASRNSRATLMRPVWSNCRSVGPEPATATMFRIFLAASRPEKEMADIP